HLNYSSGRAPFFMTSRKYAVYVDSQARAHVRVAVDGVTDFTFDEAHLRYDVIYGPDYADMHSRYVGLAGPAAMPPIWALDSMWWKDEEHRDLRHAINAQASVLDTADQLRALRIPAGAMWIDRPYGTGQNGWGNFDFDESFPDPAQLVRDVHARGMRLMLWIANRGWNRLGADGARLGYAFPGVDPAIAPAIDLRNPTAYAWLKQQLDTFVQLGIDGYKIDRGEEGEQPDSVQNENQLQLVRLVSDATRDRDG